MLTVRQAAEHATVSEALIRQWIRDGQLPVYRLGAKGRRGHIRINPTDLNTLLASFKSLKVEPEEVTPPVPRKSLFKHLKF